MASAYLTSVFTDPDQHIELRLDAAKIQRKFEAPKITRPTAGPADDPANQETYCRLELARRRLALGKAGMWPAPEGWGADLRPGQPFKVPAGAGDLHDTTKLGERMKVARLGATAKS